jgi:hypothetical protein
MNRHLRAFLSASFVNLAFADISSASPYEEVLRCDNGAAVVSVSKDERRNAQLRINDQNIMKYLNNIGVVSLNFGATELVVGGTMRHGVFRAEDFVSFSNQNQTVVSREGQGLKVKWMQQVANTGLWWCDGVLTYEHGGQEPGQRCDGQSLRFGGGNWRFIPAQFEERANWYFQSCQLSQ